MSAAETGHLVLSTLHTIDAGQTINRILGMFETEEQEQIRAAPGGHAALGRQPASGAQDRRRALTRCWKSWARTCARRKAFVMGESEGKSFYEIIEASQPFGWRTFDQACLEAYEQGIITEETALLYCTKRGAVTRGIDNIKKRRGESTTPITELKMKTESHSGEKPRRPCLLLSRLNDLWPKNLILSAR